MRRWRAAAVAKVDLPSPALPSSPLPLPSDNNRAWRWRIDGGLTTSLVDPPLASLERSRFGKQIRGGSIAEVGLPSPALSSPVPLPSDGDQARRWLIDASLEDQPLACLERCGSGSGGAREGRSCGGGKVEVGLSSPAPPTAAEGGGNRSTFEANCTKVPVEYRGFYPASNGKQKELWTFHLDRTLFSDFKSSMSGMVKFLGQMTQLVTFVLDFTDTDIPVEMIK
uniref:Uncharacterized protein n=1 Tax=Oryza rufipogon TaxID=4529 RepID=A0A0E0RB83_ORYRU